MCLPVRHLDGLVYRDAGPSVAAEHLLGVHPAVRFLPAHGTSPVQARRTGLCGRGTGHGGDGALHAGGCRSVWGAHACWARPWCSLRCWNRCVKIPPAAGLWFSVAVRADLPSGRAGYLGFGVAACCCRDSLYQNFFTAFFGFYPSDSSSTDYFALLPWLFLFWSGFFLHHLIGRERMEPLRRSICPALGWLGRHSLVLYLLHQPVIYGVLSAAAVLFA